MKVSIKVYCDIVVEGDDDKAIDVMQRDIELQWSILREQIEAVIAEKVIPLHPGVTFISGADEDGDPDHDA